MYRERMEKLCRCMQESELDGMLICPSEELVFLTGFTPMMCERFQGLFLTAGGESFYICNLLYGGEIAHALKGIKTYCWMDGESMTDTVRQALSAHGLQGGRIGVNSSAQAFNVLDIMEGCQVQFMNGRHILEEARIIKTAEEIKNLRLSAQIADRVFDKAVSFIRPGMKEEDIFQFICGQMIEAGGTDPWGIIASGPNSSYPHYMGTDRVIQEQDLMILDFGCVYNGMHSDMSRTVFVGGITEEQQKVYDIVRKSNEAGEKTAVTGAWIPDVDKASRDIITEAGYGETFINRLGHGIGYMVHEAPDIKKNNTRKLEKGMAFSIEPGIYIAGRFGMRIEDIVVTTENGNEILNQSTKDLIIIR